MHGHDSDHYDVQFTTRQLVVLFGLLIVIVVGVFVGGIVIGRGMAPGAADAVVARRTNPVPVPSRAATPAEAPAEDVLRLPIRSEPQPTAPAAERAPVRPAASPAQAPRPPIRRASTSPEQLSGRTLAAPRPRATAAASPAPRTAAATPPSPRTADRPKRPAGGKFTIQVAAFRDRAAAERMLQQLAARGIEGYLEGTPAGIFRVRVGQFESREAARALAARLESEKFATLVTSR